MAKMHHFKIEANAESGFWNMDSIDYLGEIDAAEHYAKKDTDTEHYDQHDGEALDERFWHTANLPRDSRNVAITIVWTE